MANIVLYIGVVEYVETPLTPNGSDGCRIRARLPIDSRKNLNDIPWAFPLMPKTFHTIPQVGEGVLVFLQDSSSKMSQRFYIGPIISQPQYQKFCSKADGTSLMQCAERDPLPKASNYDATTGSFPEVSDVAVVGRGAEDIILRYNDTTKSSEVDIRAGIRGEYKDQTNPSLTGNVIFQGVDPAYIQLKHKNAIASGEDKNANSLINVVANRVNIMSNMDVDVEANLDNNNTLVDEATINDTMSKLHQVPKGDKLVEFLELMRTVLLTHVHSWPGNPQSGDNAGKTPELSDFNIKDILSDYVRIS